MLGYGRGGNGHKNLHKNTKQNKNIKIYSKLVILLTNWKAKKKKLGEIIEAQTDSGK